MTDPAFEAQLAWARLQSPRLRRALARLPSLAGVRLACSMHLELKMVALVEGLLARGAQVFLTTCNATTVRDEVVQCLVARGAQAHAWKDLPPREVEEGISRALAWEPTHLCEMGADLTAALVARGAGPGRVRASLEATGSGISRLNGIAPPYPIFNWDDLPIKEGLHNRHMVGITAWHAFFERTRLTLHGKRTLVVGYGSVGRGVAQAARAYGGAVVVAERDPARALEARYAGWEVAPLEEALPRADVVATATGASGIIGRGRLSLLRDGAFLLNVGHRADEIDVAALLENPHRAALPFVEEVQLGGRTVYLFAGGSMANLTAGHGDSLNAFDVTLATMAAALGFLCSEGERAPAGVHVLPRRAWESAAEEP